MIHNKFRSAQVAAREAAAEATAKALAEQAEFRDRLDWMISRGFRMVLDPITGRYARDFDAYQQYQFMRTGWEDPRVFKLAECHPAMNVSGLFYRP